MADKNNLLLLFDRPTEPIFIGKGENNVSFDVPPEYYTDRYKPLATDIQNRFSVGKVIPISKFPIPDISFPLLLGRNEPFSLFNRYHGEMASKLIEILMATKSIDELLSLSCYCRDRINPYMFIYALSVVMLHRPDTRNLNIPSHVEMFPFFYMDSSVFNRAREESVVVTKPGARIPIEIPHDYTANDLDPEHKLSYFREDIGANLHHWHWHLVYPFKAPLNIVNKDRRGELFYYMHQQIIARYNMERLSNKMNRVVRLTNWRDPIIEGYFPKLDNIVANRVYPSRPQNAKLQNINREVEQITFDIEDMERWRDRIFAAIHSGYITNTAGEKVKLTETSGIDVLGNIVESSILSQNQNLYGDLHNSGHIALAAIHDPDHRFLENWGVIGDVATAMRDPIFYRWHSYIDDILQEYKATLPSYSDQDLNFENVKVLSVEVNATGLPRNEFSTFWQKSDIELSRGLDFAPRGSVFARVTHLQHAPFSYKIIVENRGSPRIGTVRIFIAPKFDERGLPLFFREQRKLFVELDKFSISMIRGKNEIVRQSIQSSVTIPHEVTYRNLNTSKTAAVLAGTTASLEFNFCGCGWPQNLLIAKGSPEGFPCQLFVMVSNGEIDKVPDAQVNVQTCDDASSYCGIRNSRYPDSRAMGYPFDRPPKTGVFYLREFCTSNMVAQDVRIRFADRTVAPLPSRRI